jgi:hypothetical protein
VNPDDGQFHDLTHQAVREHLAQKFKDVEGAQLEEKLRKVGWHEFLVGEIIRIKGHDFKVIELRSDAIVLQSVKFVDPSAKIEPEQGPPGTGRAEP